MLARPTRRGSSRRRGQAAAPRKPGGAAEPHLCADPAARPSRTAGARRDLVQV